MSQAFDPDRFQRLRAERGLTWAGERLFWSAVTGSTNDDALTAARAGAAGGTTFVAEAQSRGRGQRGRTWYSEPGASLLFSVIVREKLALERLACLSLASGAAVRRALACRLPGHDERGAVLVKWPNDVWVDGKKIAGVLVETQMEATTLRAAVIGVGVNVGMTQLPEELTRTATSIALCSGDVERESLLVLLLEELAEAVSKLAHSGLAAFRDELSRYDALFGRRVRLDAESGVASGVDTLGRLLLKRDDGRVIPITSGTLELDG